MSLCLVRLLVVARWWTHTTLLCYSSKKKVGAGYLAGNLMASRSEKLAHLAVLHPFLPASNFKFSKFSEKLDEEGSLSQ